MDLQSQYVTVEVPGPRIRKAITIFQLHSTRSQGLAWLYKRAPKKIQQAWLVFVIW